MIKPRTGCTLLDDGEDCKCLVKFVEGCAYRYPAIRMSESRAQELNSQYESRRHAWREDHPIISVGSETRTTK